MESTTLKDTIFFVSTDYILFNHWHSNLLFFHLTNRYCPGFHVQQHDDQYAAGSGMSETGVYWDGTVCRICSAFRGAGDVCSDHWGWFVLSFFPREDSSHVHWHCSLQQCLLRLPSLEATPHSTHNWDQKFSKYLQRNLLGLSHVKNMRMPHKIIN